MIPSKLAIVILMAGFSFCILGKCDAQSIAGIWARNFSHIFSFDKSSGKKVYVSPEVQRQYDEVYAENGYKEILEMKLDNTYTITVTAGGKQTIRFGNYLLSGNILEMNIPLIKSQKTNITVVSLSGNIMIWNLVFMGKSTGVEYDRI
jgi:hypothetical protein